jgi:hypothetical protein
MPVTQKEITMDWIARLEKIERKIREQDELYDELNQRLDGLKDMYDMAVRHREALVAALTDITEAHRAAAGLAPAVKAAERVLEVIEADGFYEEIPPWLEKRQIDRWIDATGTAPPGVDFSHLREYPHRNPPGAA